MKILICNLLYCLACTFKLYIMIRSMVTKILPFLSRVHDTVSAQTYIKLHSLNGTRKRMSISLLVQTLKCIIRKIYRVSQKKCASDFSSHYWHTYFTHMKNKDRYGILTILAFHAIFCFYPTPFLSLAIVRQSTSPPKSNTLF